MREIAVVSYICRSTETFGTILIESSVWFNFLEEQGIVAIAHPEEENYFGAITCIQKMASFEALPRLKPGQKLAVTGVYLLKFQFSAAIS